MSLIVLPYAGVFGVFYVALSMMVVRQRRITSAQALPEHEHRLERIIRGHGNFGEYVPFSLLLMFLMEFKGNAPATLLHGLGILLLVGRCLHAYAFVVRRDGSQIGRIAGTISTMTVVSVASLYCLWAGLR